MTRVEGLGQERPFTLEEANVVLPDIESILLEMDGLDARRREISDLIEDMEAYWGESVEEPTNPEYEKFISHQSEVQELTTSLNDCVIRIHSLGGQLKSHEHGLVDFYSVREGRTVFLCWQRGEEEIQHYHELDAGFSGRQPLSPRA